MDVGKGVGAMLAATILLYGFGDMDLLGYHTKGGDYPAVGLDAEIAAYEESLKKAPGLRRGGRSGFDA